MICGFAQLAKRFCKFSNEPMVPRGPATNECIAATFDEQGKLYFCLKEKKNMNEVSEDPNWLASEYSIKLGLLFTICFYIC